MGQGREELNVFVGVAEPDLFAQEPHRVAVAMPDDERNARLADFDGDGRTDLLIHYPSTTEPHRVTLLIAR